MAIIECVPGIEVTVVSGGNTIKEYVDEETEDESNKVTRYIKAISGQNFEVHIKVAKDFEVKGDDLAFRIYMDGRWVAGPLISKKTISEGCGRRVSQGRQSDGSKYCFSTLETGAEWQSVELIFCLLADEVQYLMGPTSWPSFPESKPWAKSKSRSPTKERLKRSRPQTRSHLAPSRSLRATASSLRNCSKVKPFRTVSGV